MATFSHLLEGVWEKETATEVAQASSEIQCRLGDFPPRELHKADQVIVEFSQDFTNELRAKWS